MATTFKGHDTESGKPVCVKVPHIYEMLTGELPFSGSSALSVMRAKTHEEPRPPTYFAPNLDPTLDAIVCKAMARNARDRYQHAEQMLDAEHHFALIYLGKVLENFRNVIEVAR